MLPTAHTRAQDTELGQPSDPTDIFLNGPYQVPLPSSNTDFQVSAPEGRNLSSQVTVWRKPICQPKTPISNSCLNK